MDPEAAGEGVVYVTEKVLEHFRRHISRAERPRGARIHRGFQESDGNPACRSVRTRVGPPSLITSFDVIDSWIIFGGGAWTKEAGRRQTCTQRDATHRPGGG